MKWYTVHVDIPYGKNKIGLEIDKERVMNILSPSEVTPAPNPELEVIAALKRPIRGPTIDELAPRGKTVAVAVDDMSRMTPTQILLPQILGLLEKAGTRREDIKIIVALGTHRRMSDHEMKEKYGAAVVENYEVINHAYDDSSELDYLGKIAEEMPIWINKHYLRADIRIATGNIVPHYNAGWGAGAKILLPGLAGEETVGRMHVYSATTTPNGLGMEENPTRKLIDAFGEKIGVHFTINTVVSGKKELAKVFGGHFVEAHRKGIDFAKNIYGVKTSGRADITISSSFPADMDYWQGLKGLFSADLATRSDGGIIELTPCHEGISAMHPKWIDYLQYDTRELSEMCEATEVEDTVALGLALNVAYVRGRHSVCMVSDGISEADAERMGFQKFKRVEDALEFLSRRYGFKSKVNIITQGGETYPVLE